MQVSRVGCKSFWTLWREIRVGPGGQEKFARTGFKKPGFRILVSKNWVFSVADFYSAIPEWLILNFPWQAVAS